MKRAKILLLSCMITVMSLGIYTSFAQGWTPRDTFPDAEYILTEGEGEGEPVIDDTNVDGSFGGGADAVSEGVVGIINDPIADNATARDKATRLVRGFLNYVLGLIGLVALLYMLYHGFLALTAGANNDQRNKGISGIKYAAIALIGIGVSWFIISGILWLIFTVSDAVL